ncbi:DNA repair protein RadA [Mycetocola reblochoni]|uniref:DNA repair protein RadA n=2 Tax=Mycetocola reblochoni TaxID=331618 RepID=A0A1R4I746_9MICO|nr:DNA repair protein RadA [Mycetocola reblochoni]RLP68900.1 DNA repair protein RadA [Mycetocola reblochoni]SJN15506.1 DNA repair protein RadA [Mycetocola reblochoni REB411]
MAKTMTGYQCSECGWRTTKWVGRCGECQQWGTVTELGAVRAPTTAASPVPPDRRAQPITTLQPERSGHRAIGIGEFDRVLGGGIVPGAAVLLSGEPGVGKSTLLLDVAARVAGQGATVLYISGEESSNQIRLRASRTQTLHESLLLASETDLGTVLGHIDQVSPSLLIVDSVQTIASAALDGQPGQPAQVREVAGALVRIAKERDMPTIIVGHVTKDGSVAGPRILEHLVDVVCHFEGDRDTSLRFIRALKNRFGPTDEVGCFEMTAEGISEVADPSGLFLSRGAAVSGTCVTLAAEGRRLLPVEIQALVTNSSAPNPRRVTNGVDSARVAMLIAVLERRVGIPLTDKDVYVSTVGGVRLTEPAADLAIAVAIASAARDVPIPHEMIAFGEISLAGEIRPVTAGKQRRAESGRLGYTRHVDDDTPLLRDAVREALSAGESSRERELSTAF